MDTRLVRAQDRVLRMLLEIVHGVSAHRVDLEAQRPHAFKRDRGQGTRVPAARKLFLDDRVDEAQNVAVLFVLNEPNEVIAIKKTETRLDLVPLNTKRVLLINGGCGIGGSFQHEHTLLNERALQVHYLRAYQAQAQRKRSVQTQRKRSAQTQRKSPADQSSKGR